jgi:UDP-glucose 4-epimerase
MNIGKTVLVTGGLGYIGSHTVVELMEAGFKVVVADNLSNSTLDVHTELEKLTNSRISFYKIDVGDKKSLELIFKENEISSVIHFAAYKSVGESMENVLEYYENNIGSLLSILSAIQKYKVKNFVFSSSCTVYGQPDVLPVNENSPIKNAESVYGTTKIMGEKIIQDFVASSTNVNAILLRYFNPVGAHESGQIGEKPVGVPNNLFPFITQTISGVREEIKVFGSDYNTPDGTALRDYIHVVDLAKAHLAAILRMEYSELPLEIFNVGTGVPYSVLEVIKMFENVIEKPINYSLVERRQGDIEKIFAESTQANNVLKWKATKGLEEMVSSALKWERIKV